MAAGSIESAASERSRCSSNASGVLVDTLKSHSRIAKIAMPRGSKPGERRGGRQKGTPNKTVVAKAAHILAAAAKAPSFSAYIRLFQLAEDYDRDLAVALAKRPQKQTEIAECRERLARTLKDLLPYEKPRLTTTKVQGDRNAPLFDLTMLSDKELTFLRRTVLKARQIDEGDDAA
jgi:hypothetical protein